MQTIIEEVSSLGSAEPGNKHVHHTGDMLASLRMHVDPTGDMLPSLRAHWLSSGCLPGRVEHKLGKQIHVLVQNTRHIGKYMTYKLIQPNILIQDFTPLE